MYCQECGKEAQAGEVICSSCGGALTDAELDLPEVGAPPAKAPVEGQEEAAAPGTELTSAVPAPTAPAAPEVAGPVASEAARGPRLEVVVGGLSGSSSLKPQVTTIGRLDPAADHAPDVDLNMDAAVSRRHAEIKRTEAGYRIVDVGSTNGTVVNGQQIPRHQEVALADGDEIHIGENCKLTLRL